MPNSDLIMPIHTAIRNGNLDEVMRLIGDDESLLQIWTPFGTWLHDAANLGQLDIAKWFISQGLDVNAYNDSTVRRPIDKAAANGHVDVVKALIAAGSILDTEDSVRNPLFAAIVGGLSESHTAIAKLLIDNGIDTTVKYNLQSLGKGVDARAFARAWGRLDIVRLLENS